MALDKPKPNRTYFYVVDMIPNDPNPPQDNNIHFDVEWLAITKLFNDYQFFKHKDYDYSQFIRNNELYLKHVEKNKGKTIIRNNDFDTKLKFYKDNFTELVSKDGIWKFTDYNDQRNYIIKTLGMHDSHLFKKRYKEKNYNKEKLVEDIQWKL